MNISTKRLKINELSLDDLKSLEKKNEKKINDLDEIIKRVKENPNQLFYNTINSIFLSENDKAIGSIYFKGLDDGQLEVYYQIDEDKRDLGYATEALGGMIKKAFEDPHVDVICAYVNETNPAAVRVLAKNRFRFIKETIDGNYYEILK